MPQYGLRPTFRFTRIENSQIAADENRWFVKHEREPSPTGLFYTNQWLSTTAVAIFHQNVPLYINIYPRGISYANETLLFIDPSKREEGRSEVYRLRSHLGYEHLPQFTSMRNYRLNIILDANWYDDTWFGCGHERGAAYAKICSIFKEQLRFVSDSLSSNNDIRCLSITVPCFCCLKRGGRYKATFDKMLDFLMPLKRLRVAKSVILEAVYDNSFDGLKGDVWLNACLQPECQQLARQIKEALGELDGEQLSHEEQAWKRLKVMAKRMSLATGWEMVRRMYQLLESA
ncbi:MAG: hypothetical protein Q9166_006184 [cf. Caloplaca sp. 2 TL-2023]